MNVQDRLKKDPVLEWIDRRIEESKSMPTSIRVSRDMVVINRDEVKEAVLKHLKDLRDNYIRSQYPELDEYRLYGGRL